MAAIGNFAYVLQMILKPWSTSAKSRLKSETESRASRSSSLSAA